MTTIVPLRFGAIYRSREHVGRMLDERGDEFAATLERVRGHVELGVKVWVDRQAGTDPRGRSEPAAGGVGAAYLQRRRQEQERSREVAARCVDSPRRRTRDSARSRWRQS